MQRIQHIAQSAFFLFGGMFVLALSLHFTSVRETMASTGEAVEESSRGNMFDVHMPGSVPYLVERVGDKISAFPVDEPQKASLYLEFSEHRLESAQYAFESGNVDIAINTLSKSLGYLRETKQRCHGFVLGENASEECISIESAYHEQLAAIAETNAQFLNEISSEALRSHSIRLQHDLDVF